MNTPLTAAACLLLLAVACGDDAAQVAFEPAGRAVRVETVGCDTSSGRTGSGVAVGGGRVVTVAHLVARVERIEATVAGGSPFVAEVAAYDPARDLALLEVPTDGIPDLETVSVGAGASGVIVGGAASGDVAFDVIQPVSLSIEEVLGTERHSRVGYEVDATTATGDSGAGAYDADGRLIGIVFAITEAGGSSWLTAASEIEQFLAADPAGHPPGCG